MKYFKGLLENNGFDQNIAFYVSFFILVLIVAMICFLTVLIMRKVVLKIIIRIIKSNRFVWDDIFLERKVFHRMINIIPGIIIYASAPFFEKSQGLVKRFASIYILISAIFLFNAIIDAVNDIYQRKPIAKVRPIKGLLQVIKIIFCIIIAITVIARLMNESPLIMLSGIGALAAVFSFVFKDSILGFIAGIQLTSNDMLRIGDWIEMSKYGADGDVIDITLNTVKVQNFDKSIVTIPAYALVSDSFKNWRGMMEFGGRRIKRSINIDVNSIGFCTPEMLDKFKKINYLKKFIIEKEKELKEYNVKNKVESDMRAEYMTKAEADMNAEADMKAEPTMNAESGMSAKSMMKAETNEKTEAMVNAESKMKAKHRLNAETSEKNKSIRNAESRMQTEFGMRAEYNNVEEETSIKAEINQQANFYLLMNGSHMTNIGIFREYISHYLKNYPDLNKEMVQMVRQLPPDENGLPIEIYVFTKNTEWENYEYVQADIFDHIISVAGEFGLRIFQNPTGYDVKQINNSTSAY